MFIHAKDAFFCATEQVICEWMARHACSHTAQGHWYRSKGPSQHFRRGKNLQRYSFKVVSLQALSPFVFRGWWCGIRACYKSVAIPNWVPTPADLRFRFPDQTRLQSSRAYCWYSTHWSVLTDSRPSKLSGVLRVLYNTDHLWQMFSYKRENKSTIQPKERKKEREREKLEKSQRSVRQFTIKIQALLIGLVEWNQVVCLFTYLGSSFHAKDGRSFSLVLQMPSVR